MTGALMAAEMAEAAGAFARAARQDTRGLAPLGLAARQQVYTIARGSSDTAATMLSYTAMRVLRRPFTSLPPSVFAGEAGPVMPQALALAISQSGGSDDLVRAALGARAGGAVVVSLINAEGSPLAARSDAVLPLMAGPELAVPATKSVLAAVGAGLALIAHLAPGFGPAVTAATEALEAQGAARLPQAAALVDALTTAQTVFVVSRDAGFGAAQEVALKLKECCALHAEAYSAAEVLHGPLQLATRPMLVLILDPGQPAARDSLSCAEARLTAAGARVIRVALSDIGQPDGIDAAAGAALLLNLLYPVVLDTALALGLNPDAPSTLAKVTRTS